MALTEVGKILYKRGCKANEIKEMMKIENEDFGMDVKDKKYIGHIVYWNNHYYYRGHDRGYTYHNCGLYAMKRLLFVLGKHPDTGIGEDLWYRYTDKELRDMLVRITGNENNRKETEFIGSFILQRLIQERFGVPDKYNKGIYGADGRLLDPLD
jgi:hypothetical protein